MKRFLILCGFYACTFGSLAVTSAFGKDLNDDKKFPSLLGNSESAVVNHWVDSMYTQLHLDSAGLNRSVFFNACKGYEYLLSKNLLAKKHLLTICDYSQPSSAKRLYVLDMEKGLILYNTYVSHGRNSGKDMASSFSNLNNSHKSSLGFMITAETYRGKAGYSMRFDGQEHGINSNVRKRDIVMHGSFYVNGERADEGQMMGRSYGCPAVPYEEHKNIIDEIKDGSCFFAYYPDAWYAHSSQIVNARFNWPALEAPLPPLNIAALNK
ncbi:murein L,D-transpeptidase catalytic domain family protein [Deminuibacter soli]|uniref:Murein L,D-transpeptidase catalytic domain family protein n=1 Tax=Deminuibacter soli TaxID=2291815 RepID=A0A3E1NPX1_9BACT|nr:murein L,D-transpeptidase catalytic domain family protein [Deminuibacter soli]RFM29960.1 hypothetical protein DXN05_03020 [Deminuibacter soli]